jgi:hypothetical protein
MTRKFCDVPIGARFTYKGGEFVKLALSLAQDKERIGNVFHAETLVEVILCDPA